ncbi:MAG: Xaa-Pro peptidase family protein [Anaerolineae bacterium]|nr:Xaa-Pro peptidase family protein [Anaerolineae bacterium]
MTIEERLATVRAAFDEWGVDGVLISDPLNRRWLSGFTGSAGWLLILPDAAWLATDFRYWEQAAHQAPDYAVHQMGEQRKISETVRDVAAGYTLGVEATHLTLRAFADLEAVDEVTWQKLPETVEPLRAVKTGAELERIRRAAAITDSVAARIPELARPGISESELAWLIERSLREAGAEAVAFDVIAASGRNAALPHHHPGDRRLQEGDALIIDMGAQVGGYKSDLTRTFFLGAEPDARFRDIYDLTLRAQQAALDDLRPGLSGVAADALARDVIGAAGHAGHFGHGLGHGVGLNIHEAPGLGPTSTTPALEPGMVVTVEPGIYISGWGGVRIEDLAVVTGDGVELLSHAPKEPAIAL